MCIVRFIKVTHANLNYAWCQNVIETVFIRLLYCNQMQQLAEMEQQVFKPLPEMDFSIIDGANVVERWQKWKQTIELFLKLAMSGISEKEKRDVFLCIIRRTTRS